MEKYIHLIVFRFLMGTMHNPELQLDPLTAELADHRHVDRFNRTQRVDIRWQSVYNLYMYHANELTESMVSEEVSFIMYGMYDNGQWAELGRPSLLEIAERRRAELKSGSRPILRLVNPQGKVIYSR